MKHTFLFLIALVLTTATVAQDAARYSPVNGYGFRYKRFAMDSITIIPLSTSPHTPYREGGLRWDITNKSLQGYDGTSWLDFRANQINDSSFVFGKDTIRILGTGGGGGGTVTQVNTGYGVTGGPITSVGTISVDSASLASYFLRRKDSTLYTTITRLQDTAIAIRAAIGAGGGNALDKTKIDLGRLPAVKQRYPAQGLTATGTTVTNYPITALDSNALPFTTVTNFLSGIKYGGVLWPTPVGDSMRITAPFGVLIGSSFVEGHSGLHGRLHWLLSGVPQGTFNPTYPDSVGQMSYHLRELTGYRWYNHGIGGQTSRQTWLRWMRDVAGDSISNSIDSRGSRTLSRKPYIVIYDGVGNDPYFGLTPDDSKMYLEFMSKWCQDNGARLVVFNSPTGLASTVAAYTHLETVNKWLEDGQLDKYGTVVFDLKRYWSDPAWNYDGIHMRPDISADGIHFTKAGYDSLSRWVFEVCKIPKITGIGIVNNLAPTNPVTNFAYTSGFTVQGVPYTMGSQSAVLPLLAPLTSDSVWVKATALTTVAGAGTQYGYGHWYWQLDNNITNDSLYTRKTNGSNAAQSNTPKITKMEIWPANHLNNELVLDIKNAANDNSSFRFLTGNYPKALFNTTTELGTGAILSVGNAGQATSIQTQGHLKVDGTTNNIGWLEIIRGTGLPTTLGRGIAINGTGTEFAFYSGAMANKDQFSFGDYTAPGTIPLRPNPTAIVAIKQTGFGNANASNQIGNVLSLKPTYNQTDGAQLNIALRGIYYNPILTSLTNTRHYGAFLVTGNNYFNIAADSTCFGCDSLENTLAKFRVKGSVRLDGQLTGNNTMKLLVKGADSLIYQVDPSAVASAAGVESSIQYKSGSTAAGNTYAKYIDSSRAIETVKLYAGKIAQAGDTAYRFSPYLLSYFFGNSITAGSAITPQYYRWPTRVANGTNTLEKNYGIGGTRLVSLATGDSAMQERTFLVPTYSATRDAYLFFAYGTNDAVTGSIDTATFRSVYYGVIDDATGKGWPVSRIVVVSPGFFIHSNSTLNARGPIFRDVARSIAIAKGVKFVDTRAAQQEVGEMQTLKLPTDSTHLNEYGNQVWALAILDTLGQKSGDVRANGYLFGRSLHLRAWANGGLGNAYATNALPPAISITDSTEQVVLEMRAALGSSTDNESNGVGVNSLQNMTTGNANLAFGPKSLQALTTGSNNTAIGSAALYTQTTGDNNTAVGKNAMFSNTTSSENVAIGRDASYSNTTGTANAAGGYRSLRAGTTANNNTGWGYYTLEANTASGNGAFGASALRFNTSGSANNAFGSNALLVNTTGSSNTAMGNRAGRGVTGSFNSLFGANAGDSVTSSPSNSLYGYRAGYNLKTGAGFNIFIGEQAGLNVTTGSENIIIGKGWNNSAATTGLLWLSPKQNDPRIYSIEDGKTGFGTSSPQFRVHVGGKLGIDTVSTGFVGDSLLTFNTKEVRKMKMIDMISGSQTAGHIPIVTSGAVLNLLPRYKFTTLSATGNVFIELETMHTVKCDATAGNITATITTPLYIGIVVNIKKMDASANTVTVVPPSGTIDGAGTIVLTTQYENKQIQWDGTNWLIL